MTNAEAWFNNSLRPRKPEGSLGRTAQDGHLDYHTAPELYDCVICGIDRLAFKGEPSSLLNPSADQYDATLRSLLDKHALAAKR